MTIELLYFDECDNWEAAWDELRNVLAELGRDEPITLVRVPDDETAQRLRFLGSPTVRVNGQDVEPNERASDFMMGCRLYWVNGKPQGTPPREWLLSAVRNAARARPA